MHLLYRVLLHLYPPAFRRAHGREMQQCLRALERSPRSPRSRIALASLITLDLVRSLPREWIATVRESQGGARPARRDATGGRMESIRSIPADVRFAIRLLIRHPMFAIAATGTLALAIGANTAIFGLIDRTILRPVKAANPKELVAVPWSTAYPDYRDYTSLTDVFSGVLATSGDRFNLSIDGTSELQNGLFVSGNTFSVLGLSSAAGRPLLPDDDAGPGAAVVGVISYDYWRTRFGSDPAAVGKTIRVNGRPVLIVGVAPEGFRGLSLSSSPVIYLPLTSVRQISAGFFARAPVLEHRGLVWLNVVGRLRPGVSIDQAGGAIESMYRRLHPPQPGSTPERLTLVPLGTRALGGRDATQVQRFVLLLGGVVALTLLIGCANLANLLLARAAGRRHEVGVRLALGASRGRIARQLIAEHVALGLVGGVAALPVAHAAFGFLSRYELPGGIDIEGLSLSIDPATLTAGATLSVFTGLLLGAVPAWRASKGDVLARLRGATNVGESRNRIRASLVAVQVALSLVLLAGTGLFLRSLAHALNIPLGFTVEGAVSASANLALARYDAPRARGYRQVALDRVRALPGVTAAGWTVFLPTRGAMIAEIEAFEGYEKRAGERMSVYTPQVGGGYFRAAGTRILAGRPIEEADAPGSPPVAVINEATAARFWPGQNAIGKRILVSADRPWVTVVGVAQNTVASALGDEAIPFVYFSIEQAQGGFGPPLSASLLVRTTEPPDTLLRVLREQLRALDPEVPLHGLQPLEFQVRELVMPQRMGVTLFGFFGLLALSLATVGVYGVASAAAALRTREIGIRMALGADARRIGRLVLGQAAWPCAAGIAAGLCLALWSARLLRGFMHGGTSWDPLTFALVTVVLAALAVIASYIPARRAARMDPVAALRHD